MQRQRCRRDAELVGQLGGLLNALSLIRGTGSTDMYAVSLRQPLEGPQGMGRPKRVPSTDSRRREGRSTGEFSR
jgi:hypothetical protein